MKKGLTSLVLVLVLCLCTLAACGKNKTASEDKTVIRVGSLKGPTSIGIIKMMEDDKDGANYDFTVATQADELAAGIIKGELDIALVPANMASILYGKTEGKIKVIDINTLGVLYFVGADTSIDSLDKLSGKTIYLTGKGTTPDYVLQYLLGQAGVEAKLEYKSEAAEVVSVLANDKDAIGFLPQPFVTASLVKNDALSILLNANDEWNKLQGDGGSKMVTGVTVVRSEFLEEHPERVKAFLSDHKASAEFVNSDLAAASAYVEEFAIIEKAKIAEMAIPYCNITYIDGNELKDTLSGYLSVLYEMSPESVGGKLPEEGFYYN